MNFNQKLYVMTLTLSIISIIYSYNVCDVNAQINRTQVLTIQLNQDLIEFKPPIDINILNTNSTMTSPTFNPPLKKCKTTTTTDTEDGFDITKYVLTGDFVKDKLKEDNFAFQIFADLINNDEVEINRNDAPYKANILTDQDNEIKVNLEDIATLCIDTQHVIKP